MKIKYLLILTSITLGANMTRAAEIVIGGTGAALGTMQALSMEYMRRNPADQVKVLPSLGSGGGIKALAAGKISVAVTARPLNESERGGNLQEHKIAHTPMVIAVSNKNPASKLTLEELAAIYSGTTARWPDGTAVRLVLRPKDDTDTVLLKGFSPAMAQATNTALAREGMLVANTDTESADALERLPGAIGTAALSTIVSERRALKALTINGHEPGTTAPASNRYPWHKTIYLMTAENATPAVASFMRFVGTPAARAILSDTGNIPAAGK